MTVRCTSSSAHPALTFAESTFSEVHDPLSIQGDSSSPMCTALGSVSITVMSSPNVGAGETIGVQTETMDFLIRVASAGDVDSMQRIEIDAGRRFAELGMHSIAEAAPESDQNFLASVAVGRVWMAVDEDNRPLGYAVSSERMGFVTVPPSRQGPELRAIRAAETDAGIDVAPRIAMIRHLPANSS
jgi:hypothetical protein